MRGMMFEVKYVCSAANYEYPIAFTASEKDAELLCDKANNPPYGERKGAHDNYCCFYYVIKL